MKGIILAGGTGSRMLPMTSCLSKQLLPVYDKPMIYYPLATLMLAGIREILIITRPTEKTLFESLLGSGTEWGISIEYVTQKEPNGIPEAFILGADFIGQDQVCLILGDNILQGQGLHKLLHDAIAKNQKGATIFVYPVRDPERYGIVNFDKKGKPLSIEEKPKTPSSHLAVIGMYFYDNSVVDIAKTLKPSKRGELEITEINQHYLTNNTLNIVNLGRGMAWLDTGTPEALLDASNFVHVVEKRQGLKICCPEEVAWRMNFIDDDQFKALAQKSLCSDYGKYLNSLLLNKISDEYVSA